MFETFDVSSYGKKDVTREGLRTRPSQRVQTKPSARGELGLKVAPSLTISQDPSIFDLGVTTKARCTKHELPLDEKTSR